MAKTTLQLRRGTTGENSTFTGALGEVVVDTSKKTLVVHDGATPGGSTLATLVSPAFTGTPTAPQASYGDDSSKIATTSFVADAIAGFSAGPTSSDDVTEGAVNKYFTKNNLLSALSASGNISITQPGGSGTNVRISYTQPTNVSAFNNDAGYLTTANITGSLSVTSSPNTALQYDPGTGIFTFTQAVASVNGYTNVIVLNTDDISDSGRTNKWASSTTVRGYLSAGTGITYTSGTGAIALTNTSIQIGGKTFSLTSGSNQAYTTDDITQGSTNLYASATNVRAALSAGTGVGFSGGVISIGQDIATSASPSFANLTATTNLTVNTNLIKTDAGNSRVGINKTTPAYTLDVAGDVNFTGKLRTNTSAGTAGYVLQSNGDSSFAVTGASGTGVTATITFGVQAASPFIIGQSITVSNVNPSGYNGTYTVTGVSNSTVSYASSTQTTYSSGGTISSASPSWVTIGNSIPEIIELDKIRDVRNAQSTWYGFINGTTFTDPEDAIGTTGIGVFTNGMVLTPSSYIMNGINGTGSISYTASITGTTMTVTSQPVVGEISATTSFASGGTASSNQIIMAASASVTVAYVSGGAVSAVTMILASTTGVYVGQSISGTGVPTGTLVTFINGNTITFNNLLTAQASGSYTFQFNGIAGVQVGQSIIGTGIPAGTTVTALNAGTLTITISNLLTEQAAGFYSYYGKAGSLINGMGVNALNYVAGNLVTSGTYIVSQLTSTSSIITQLTFSSGGAQNATTITFTSRDSVAPGQLITGTGIPTGTFVIGINGLVVTISKALTTQAAGTYNLYTAGTIGTYQVNNTYATPLTSMTIVSGVVTVSLDATTNSDLDAVTPAYQLGQRVTVSGTQPGVYNGTYFVTAATPTTISFASTATGNLISPGYIVATLNEGRCEITGTNQVILNNCTINGTTLTIGSIASGTVSIGQALFGPGIINLYIVSGSGLSWTLNRSQGNLGSFTVITATSYTVYPAQSILPTLINGQSKLKDGGNSTFPPTTNGNIVTITNPIQVQLVKNGAQLSPWLNNSGSVWQNVTPFGDYTVDNNGNIVFATPPQVADTVTGTILVGRSVNPVVKTYPFRALDIMLGT